MDFKKDLLIIDTEFSGFDPKRHDLLQLAAVLLDRKTLKEKKVFNSFIKPSKWKNRETECMKINQITWDQVKDAPILRKVIQDFNKQFNPERVLFTSYTGFADKTFLLSAYKQARVLWKFDYHYFDIWSFCYAYFASQNKLNSRQDFAGFGLESLVKRFKIKTEGKMHDALTDCRIEAEVLRRVIKKL